MVQYDNMYYCTPPFRRGQGVEVFLNSDLINISHDFYHIKKPLTKLYFLQIHLPYFNSDIFPLKIQAISKGLN